MDSFKRYYLTTPIYYVSDKPHLGHAYTTIIGDTICRYQRMRLGKHAVFYLTGTDEHGEKIERAAKEKGLPPQTFVDEIASTYQELWKVLHIEHDDFIRTTEPRHEKVVQALWQKLLHQGAIYKGEYEGWYCVACESFYPEKDLLPENRCPDHKRPVERLKEEGYFFRLSQYEQALLQHYQQHPDFIEPPKRMNEVRAFVERGLKDLSISRSSFSWGIPVPNDPKQVIYVWIDALTNYYSALQESKERQAFWGTKEEPLAIHLVGKEITRFHAIYWPAMLMALDLPLPKKIVAHGWWTVDGEKMSKTLGNVVDPHVLATDIGADALRYFVMREVPLGEDGDFSYDSFLMRYNSELANDLGNLLNRTLSMVEKFSAGIVKKGTGDQGTLDRGPLTSTAEDARTAIEQHMNNMQPFPALTIILHWIGQANAYLEHQAPFKLVKENPEKAHFVLYQVLETLRWLSMILQPFMPERATELRRQLGLQNPQEATWPTGWGEFPEGTIIQKGAPLFPRLDIDQQKAFLEKWRATRKKAEELVQMSSQLAEVPSIPETSVTSKPLIQIEDFQKLDLRVAKILQVEQVPKKDRLLKLTVELGQEIRTVVAGIGQTYSKEQLLNKYVALVANLEPAKIAGVLSQGMILAIGDNTILGLLAPDQNVPSGTQIR